MVGPVEEVKPIEDRVADVEARLETATAEQVTRIDAIAEVVDRREALLNRLEQLERRMAAIEPDLQWLYEERRKAGRR